MTAATAAGAAKLSYRRIVAIAVPVVLSNATVPILGAVDTGVVGQLGQAAPIDAVGAGHCHPDLDLLDLRLSADGHLRDGRAGVRRGGCG